jgi:hypothetical protein
VTLRSNESVKNGSCESEILGSLEKSNSKIYLSWYIAPDRNCEEEAAHQKLVAQLKEIMSADPSKYHYIKDRKVMSVVSVDKN